MPRESNVKLTKLERQMAKKNSKENGASSRSTRTTGATLRPSSRGRRRRRSLSAGVEGAGGEGTAVATAERGRHSLRATRTTAPHPLVSPQRHAVKLKSLFAMATNLTDEAVELERQSAQKRAVESFAYHPSDISEEEVSVLDLTSEDEASFDHNLPIEETKKPPRRAKMPINTRAIEERRMHGMHDDDRHHKRPTKGSTAPPALPSEQRINKKPSDRPSSRSPKIRPKSRTRMGATDTEESPKRSKAKDGTSSSAIRKIKKVKAKSSAEALQSFLEASSSSLTNERLSLSMSPTGTTPKPKVKRVSGKSTPRASHKKPLSPRSATKKSGSSSSTAATPKSASTRSRGRTTGGALPTINLEDSNGNLSVPPTNKTTKKKKIIVVRRKKKQEPNDENASDSSSDSAAKQIPQRGVSRSPSRDDSTMAVKLRNSMHHHHHHPQTAEKIWDYFGSRPDVTNSMEVDSTHTTAIYQAAVGATSMNEGYLSTNKDNIARSTTKAVAKEHAAAKSAIHETGNESPEVPSTGASRPTEQMPTTEAKQPDVTPSSPSTQKKTITGSSGSSIAAPPPSSVGREKIKSQMPPRPSVEEDQSHTLTSNSNPAEDTAGKQSPEHIKSNEDSIKSSPAVGTKHFDEQSALSSPVSVKEHLKMFVKKTTSPTSPSVESSTRGRPRSPPGFIASQIESTKSPKSPSTRQRRIKTQSLDTKLGSLQQKQREELREKTEDAIPAPSSPRSNLVGRGKSPITPARIMEAFESLSVSKHSSPARLSVPAAPLLENAIPNKTFRPIHSVVPSHTDTDGKLLVPEPSKLIVQSNHSTVALKLSDKELDNAFSEGNDGSIDSGPTTSIVESIVADEARAVTPRRKTNRRIKKTNLEASSSVSSFGTREGIKGASLSRVAQGQGDLDGSPSSVVSPAVKREVMKESDADFVSLETAEKNRSEEIEDSKQPDDLRRPRNMRQTKREDDKDVAPQRGVHSIVSDDGYEEVTIETSPDEVIHEQNDDDSYEEITVESIPEAVQQKNRRVSRRPGSVDTLRMNSGISQVTEADLVTDEERKIERRLVSAKDEIDGIQKLLAEKEAEVQMLQRRKEQLRRDRLRKIGGYASCDDTQDGDSVSQATAEAQMEWEEKKAGRLKAVRARIRKKIGEVRQLSAQAAEIQLLEEQEMEYEYEARKIVDRVRIASQQDDPESRQCAHTTEKPLANLRQRLHQKTQDIEFLCAQEVDVRDLSAMKCDMGTNLLPSEFCLGDLEYCDDSKGLEEEEVHWENAKLRRLELLLSRLDKKNDELLFLVKHKEELGLSTETSHVEDEESDEWERKRLERLQSLYRQIERKDEELKRLEDEDKVKFFSTQSLADSTNPERREDDVWERAKRRRLKTLCEDVDKNNKELELLQFESNEKSTTGDERQSGKDGTVDRDASLQRRKSLFDDLERKNREIALLKGQLQGVTRDQAEAEKTVVSRVQEPGVFRAHEKSEMASGSTTLTIEAITIAARDPVDTSDDECENEKV